MKWRILGSLGITLLLGLICIASSLIFHFSKFEELFDRNALTTLLILLGLFFIGYSIWNLKLLHKVDDEEKALSENDARIRSLQDTLDQNQKLFHNQIQLLNKIVEERSRYDSWHLKNSPIGVLAFYADGRIDKDYSEVCKIFFGDSFLSKHISEVLYTEKADRDYFNEWLSIIPFNKMPFSDLVGLLTCESTLPKTEHGERKKQKFIDLRYHFCPVARSEGTNNIEKVVVFVLDITREKKVSNELSIKEGRLEFILNILRDKSRYRKFLEVCYQSIKEIQEISERLLEGNPQENVGNAFRLVHTIRGNAAAFGVRTLRDLGDTIEKHLLLGRDGEIAIDEVFKAKLIAMLPDLKIGLETHIDETERIFNEIFDPEKSMERSFQVSNLYLSEFEGIIKQIDEIKLRSSLYRKLKEVTFVKIKKFVLQYTEIVQQMSIRQEKKISPLFISGGDVLVDEKLLEPFFTSFVHLVLNCVDHGIETPSERLERGKAEEAIIRIRVQTGDDGLYLSIEDDGRGIDPEILVEKALQKNMISKNHVAAMSVEDKYKLIFKEGFSTSRRMTSTSGRGIGMSAVKLEVEKLGGSISISSKIGKGTMFTIYLPVEAY